MSRIIPSSKNKPSTTTKPVSSQYKIFIWDVGTDSRPASESTIRTIAAVEFSSQTSNVAHFSTAVRPLNTTTQQRTPTFPEAWRSFSSFISDHSQGKPPLLVSHNAAFDVTVLLNQLERANIKLPSRWRFACSLLLARSVHPFTTDNSQLALALKFKITIDRPHHTSEDVTVLRKILVALDQNAIKHGTSSDRVVTALSDHARRPAFFDRTPQPFSPFDKDAAPKCFITQTGTKYHRKGCKWLHRSSIPRQAPPPGFKPCSQCRPDDINYVLSDKCSLKQGNSQHVSSKPTSARNTQVFVTTTGSKYHVEGCKWLGKSKIPKRSAPKGFQPCGSCIGSKAGGFEKAAYYTTKTGTKYHIGSCTSLSRSRIPSSEVPVGYDACGKCLPGVAYTGSPRLRKVLV